jgi:hypothetical protein
MPNQGTDIDPDASNGTGMAHEHLNSDEIQVTAKEEAHSRLTPHGPAYLTG